MKVVIALCLLCLLQVSIAEEEQSLSRGAAGAPAQAVLAREAREARKGGRPSKACKCKNGECKNRKGKKCRKPNKKGRKGNRKRKQGAGRKGRRKGKGKGKRPRTQGKKDKKPRTQGKSDGRQDRNTCLLADSVTTIRKYSRAVTELNSLRRIFNFRTTMAGKKKNANGTFADSLAAIKEATGGGKSCEGSADADAMAKGKEIHDKLANCSKTAAAMCDEAAARVSMNESALGPCNSSLPTFISEFKKCFTTDQATVCTCVAALTVPGDECMNFQADARKMKAQKKKCTKGDEAGSFGDCRKMERQAAKYGNMCKKGCGSNGMTTAAPSERVNYLRHLNQKMLKMNLN